MPPNRVVTVAVVGGGHNGLAMSKRLSDLAIDAGEPQPWLPEG